MTETLTDNSEKPSLESLQYAMMVLAEDDDAAGVARVKDMIEALYGEEPTENVFCPTGEGGGIDPTCKSGPVGSRTPAPTFDKPLASFRGLAGAKVSDKQVESVKLALAKSGRLNSDNTVTMYHQTSSSSSHTILKEGLTPKDLGQYEGDEVYHTAVVFVTQTKPKAAHWGSDTLEVRVPVTKEGLARLLPDPETWGGGGAKDGIKALLGADSDMAILGGVPASYVSPTGDIPSSAKSTKTPDPVTPPKKLKIGSKDRFWIKAYMGQGMTEEEATAAAILLRK